MILNRFFKRRTEAQPELEEGLKKTRRGIFADITALFDRGAIDEELYEDLEALLIQADLGVDTTLELVAALREDVRRGLLVKRSGPDSLTIHRGPHRGSVVPHDACQQRGCVITSYPLSQVGRDLSALAVDAMALNTTLAFE